MKDPIYKLIELTGTSESSLDDAVERAVSRTHATVKNLRWFEVTNIRGNLEKGKIHHWQVTIKVGFEVEE